MEKQVKAARRKKRANIKIEGTKERPKISVFRSNRYIYAQAINDEKAETITFSSSRTLKTEQVKKTEIARMVGKDIGQKLIKKGIKQAVFARGSYAYLGRVKALAEGVREAGVKI